MQGGVYELCPQPKSLKTLLIMKYWEAKNGKNIYGFGREYSGAFVLCFGLANRHCIPGAGEGEQIRSISRNAVYRNVSTTNGDSMDNWMDIHVDTFHRLGDFNVDMDFGTNPVVDTDVQGVSGGEV